MGERRLAMLRTWSAVCGAAACVLAALTLPVLLAVPAASPLPLAVAVIVSAAVLSLPLWAGGLTLAFARGSPTLSAPRQRLLFRVGAGTVGLFLVGQLAVLTRTQPIRTIGDALFGVGTLCLFALSVVVLTRTDLRFRG